MTLEVVNQRFAVTSVLSMRQDNLIKISICLEEKRQTIYGNPSKAL